MPSRKTPVDYHILAESRGFRWLGPEVADTKSKTGWECEQGHRWEARYNDIQQGCGCPTCAIESRAEPQRKKPADYHALAERRGFHWKGPEVPNVFTNTFWECSQGHHWEAPYHGIQRGNGCPVCAGRVPKTPTDYRALAKKRGFRWLGPEVPNNRTKTVWKCEKGHRWEAPYSNIQQGRGCPVCAGLAPKTSADYHALASERGFRWLGPEVPNNRTNTVWECEHGHCWEAPYSNIQQGSGCPICSGKAPKTPADYHAMARAQGIRWLGPHVPDTKIKTTWECGHGHRWEARYNDIQQGCGCPTCAIERVAEQRRNKPVDYQRLAQGRGFRWLGPKVPNVGTKTCWECKQGHQWEACYNDIQQGNGCPYCAGVVPKTPEDYHALAAERGFLWLGPKVPNTGTNTTWECEQGHRWEARYDNINHGTSCPVCADMVHGARVSQVQRDLCKMLGGELNYPFGRYNIDVAMNIDGVAIAVEYDSWYWHSHRQEQETKRAEDLLVADWRVLQIKSNALLPTQEQLDNAISRLLAGEEWVEIVLDDWGEGPTRFGSD